MQKNQRWWCRKY